MAVGLSFKKQDGAAATNLGDAKVIVYEDSTGSQYTLNFSTMNTPKLKYLPKNGTSGTDDINFSNLTELLTSIGAIKTNTDKLDLAGTADGTLGKALADLKTEADKIAGVDTKVGAIKVKTDKLDLAGTAAGTLGKALADLKIEADKIAGVDTKVGAIKVKTDKMPADLGTELNNLTAIGNAINSSGNVTEAAKLVLESSFKKAIKDAGTDGSDWLENEVRDIRGCPQTSKFKNVLSVT
ncbi:MAG: hypothetical protein ACR5K9_08430 [Wolbachia sp.]